MKELPYILRIRLLHTSYAETKDSRGLRLYGCVKLLDRHTLFNYAATYFKRSTL